MATLKGHTTLAGFLIIGVRVSHYKKGRPEHPLQPQQERLCGEPKL